MYHRADQRVAPEGREELGHVVVETQGEAHPLDRPLQLGRSGLPALDRPPKWIASRGAQRLGADADAARTCHAPDPHRAGPDVEQPVEHPLARIRITPSPPPCAAAARERGRISTSSAPTGIPSARGRERRPGRSAARRSARGCRNRPRRGRPPRRPSAPRRARRRRPRHGPGGGGGCDRHLAAAQLDRAGPRRTGSGRTASPPRSRRVMPEPRSSGRILDHRSRPHAGGRSQSAFSKSRYFLTTLPPIPSIARFIGSLVSRIQPCSPPGTPSGGRLEVAIVEAAAIPRCWYSGLTPRAKTRTRSILRLPEQEPQPAEGQQAAVHRRQDLVDVGQGQPRRAPRRRARR